MALSLKSLTRSLVMASDLVPTFDHQVVQVEPSLFLPTLCLARTHSSDELLWAGEYLPAAPLAPIHSLCQQAKACQGQYEP